jgi:acetoin utilization deacetylase AcuC-like enzyme
VPHALYFSHPACLGHDTGDNPERAERITVLEASLQQRDWLGYERRKAAPATREALVAVHAGEYVHTVRSMSERGGGAFDAETVVGPGSYEAAASAAGAACGMAEALLARC